MLAGGVRLRERGDGLTREDVLINKIVFHYDAAGRQTGYAVFDANGKLVGQTSPVRGK